MPCQTEKKPKTKPKTLAGICTPHNENAFLVARKDGYSMRASGCPMTVRLTCWISTWEFAKVITSIISLPWQPHNIHAGFNESLPPANWGSRADACSHAGQESSSRAPQLPGRPGLAGRDREGMGTWGALVAPSVPTALVSRAQKRCSARAGVKTLVCCLRHTLLQVAAGIWGCPSSLRSSRGFFPSN